MDSICHNPLFLEGHCQNQLCCAFRSSASSVVSSVDVAFIAAFLEGIQSFSAYCKPVAVDRMADRRGRAWKQAELAVPKVNRGQESHGLCYQCRHFDALLSPEQNFRALRLLLSSLPLWMSSHLDKWENVLLSGSTDDRVSRSHFLWFEIVQRWNNFPVFIS